MRKAAPRTPRPGTELRKLLASLGLRGGPGCGCEDRAGQMNAWGVEGCRERVAEIAGWLREQAEKAGWAASLKAGALALAKGLPLTYEGLVEEAIKRAEAKGVRGGSVHEI